MVHGRMFRDVALMLMLMSRQLDIGLALVLAESAKVATPDRLGDSGMNPEVVARDELLGIDLRDPA